MIGAVIALALLAQGGRYTPVEVRTAGPIGPLAGTLVDPGVVAPAVVIVPGSGPTDRDGNNPLGVAAAPYRLLAEALAQRGVATLRIDKRGMFGSKGAVGDANAVTIADYAGDVHRWVEMLVGRTARRCVWLLGHSEGALVVLQAAQRPERLCGVVLVSGAGRPLGSVLRAQLRANPANAPILAPAMAAIDTLERGKTVDVATLPPPFAPLFAPQVQPFLIDLFAHDPVRLAAKVALPMLIVHGDRDIQVDLEDAQALAKAQPRAELAILSGVNHVLKAAPEDRAGNAATYGNPSLPVARGVVEAIAAFVTRKR
jgi:hypothetical protein